MASEPARTVEIVLRAADRRPPAVVAAIAALRAAAADLERTPAAAELRLRALAPA